MEQKFSELDEKFMREALSVAQKGLEAGEAPVACVFVLNGEIIGSAHNMTNATNNATRHAEFEAIDEILKTFSKEIFKECVLYVTKPCIMCATALSFMQIKKVYFGAFNSKFGGNGTVLSVNTDGFTNKYESVGGLFEEEAINIVKQFYDLGNPNTKQKDSEVL